MNNECVVGDPDHGIVPMQEVLPLLTEYIDEDNFPIIACGEVEW
ncbi:hypothetical protein ACNKHU_02025 [Shigella flexneri]